MRVTSIIASMCLDMQGTKVSVWTETIDGVEYLRVKSDDGRIIVVPDGYVNQISLTVDLPGKKPPARSVVSRRGR